MIANIKAFRLNEEEANEEIKKNFTEVKRAAELLLNLMDSLVDKVTFESDEIDKYTTLRQAILNFVKHVEVNQGIPQIIMLDEDNIKNLNKIYGSSVKPFKNTIINDMIRNACITNMKNRKHSNI